MQALQKVDFALRFCIYPQSPPLIQQHPQDVFTASLEAGVTTFVFDNKDLIDEWSRLVSGFTAFCVESEHLVACDGVILVPENTELCC